MSHKGFLGEFEQTMLLAILQLGERAYAPAIAQHLETSIDRAVTRGALYSCLSQLERKRLVSWRLDAPMADRGGHARRFYEVTPSGVEALKVERDGRIALWRGLEDIIGTRDR